MLVDIEEEKAKATSLEWRVRWEDGGRESQRDGRESSWEVSAAIARSWPVIAKDERQKRNLELGSDELSRDDLKRAV